MVCLLFVRILLLHILLPVLFADVHREHPTFIDTENHEVAHHNHENVSGGLDPSSLKLGVKNFTYLPTEKIIDGTKTNERAQKSPGFSPNISCEEARLKCAYRVGCGMALQSYMVGCSDVIVGASQRCSDYCRNALIALTSTEEGVGLMKCKCGDSFCQDSKQRITVCQGAVLNATNSTSPVSCSVAQWICLADPLCSTALEYYNRYCRSMFAGKKCTLRCRNSISILRRQEKAAKLTSCICDGSEDYDCPSIIENMNRLCRFKAFTTTSQPPKATTASQPRNLTTLSGNQEVSVGKMKTLNETRKLNEHGGPLHQIKNRIHEAEFVSREINSLLRNPGTITPKNCNQNDSILTNCSQSIIDETDKIPMTDLVHHPSSSTRTPKNAFLLFISLTLMRMNIK